MKILIRDLMQESENVPDELKSPSLSDYTIENPISGIILPDDFTRINCIGIGYTDATEIILTFQDDGETIERTISISKSAPYQNGLYVFAEVLKSEFYESDVLLSISHNGTYVGRIGIGEYRTLGTAVSKEPGFYTTTESRVTLSGSTIPGAGGYTGRTQDVDVRYKIDSDVYDDIEKAFPYSISKSYPYFLCFDDEQHKLSANMLYFYAATDQPLNKLQSSTYKFLYSYKFNFIERF